MYPLISATELQDILHDEHIILVDAGAGPGALQSYQATHLEQALYIDLTTQLSAVDEDAANGGRHPLPDPEKFAETLTALGISNNSHIVVYDRKNGSNAAARFWWMLRAIGHEKVQVLNGGLQAAEAAGLPVSATKVVVKKAEPYKATGWQLPLAQMNEVAAKATDKNYKVIDVRDAYRYNGESEPIDLVAGHIPGSINVPFTDNLADSGLFLPAEDLRKKYDEIFNNTPVENVIVHCGSGVTACHTILAITAAGYPFPALYVGSWSEWSANDRPVATATAL